MADVVYTTRLHFAEQQLIPASGKGKMGVYPVEPIKTNESWVSKIWSAIVRALAMVGQIFGHFSNWNKSEIAYYNDTPIARQLAEAEDVLENAKTDEDYQKAIVLAEKGIAQETNRIHKNNNPEKTIENDPHLNRFIRILVTASELRAKNTTDEITRVSCCKNIRSFLNSICISKFHRERLLAELPLLSSIDASSAHRPLSPSHSIESFSLLSALSSLDVSYSQTPSLSIESSSSVSSTSSLDVSRSRSPSPTFEPPAEPASKTADDYAQDALRILESLKDAEEAQDIEEARRLYKECDQLLGDGLRAFPVSTASRYTLERVLHHFTTAPQYEHIYTHFITAPQYNHTYTYFTTPTPSVS